MNALQPLFPALHTLEPLGLPATFQDWFAYANAAQAARLARHLDAEFEAVAQAYAHAVDHAYLRSEAFRANVIQAVRAAEIAESEGKLRFIARALASCTLAFPAPSVDKFQTMRIIEGLSERELAVLAGLFGVLDPIDPYADALPVGARGVVAGLSAQECSAGLLGLAQLGLLARETESGRVDGWTGAALPAREVWKLTVLARQVALVGRMQEG